MDAAGGRKTEIDYWDGVHGRQAIRPRLPSPWRIDTLNSMRLLRRYVAPGQRVLEIGFAPGKLLAWVGARLGAQVSGLDYSEAGITSARQLFDALRLKGDFYCQDLFDNTLPEAHYDLVYSLGVIEHFEDPRPAVREHLRLVKPGGLALIAVPNYRGIYGSIQRHFDAASLLIHNLRIMSVADLPSVVPPDFPAEVRAFPFGRITPSLVSWRARWGAAAAPVRAMLDVIGLLQPFDVGPLCPWLALEVRRPRAD